MPTWLKEAEQTLPKRIYERVEAFTASLCLLLRKDISSNQPDEIPDNLAGRTNIGETFEDFHLFWPIRPKFWLQYPEDKKKEIPGFSRDSFFLKEEQESYVDIDNSLWLGQRQQTSPQQILANELFYSQQKKMGQIYSRDVDLRGNMQVDDSIVSNPSIHATGIHVNFKEFWGDRPVDSEFLEKNLARNGFSRFGVGLIAAFSTYTLFKNPRLRILSIPLGLFVGLTAWPPLYLAAGKLTGVAGHLDHPFQERVQQELLEYARENNKPLQERKPFTYPRLRNNIRALFPNQFGDQEGVDIL